MIGSSSGSSWTGFFRGSHAHHAAASSHAAAGSSHPSTTSEAASSNTTMDDSQSHPSREASSSASSSSLGSTTTAAAPTHHATPSSSSRGGGTSSSLFMAPFTPKTENTARLHVLTERKLEKAALGRATGLRQLVLLSNAFASRTRVCESQPGPSRSVASSSSYPHFDDDEDEELEPGIVDLEDEMNIKKREEDWLDSMLDEMLTDEDDEDREYYARQESYSHEGDLREPYVHLSLRDRDYRRPNDHEPQVEMPLFHEEALQHAALQRVFQDSGYLEAADIPLPPSPERSPASSAHSQDSDDEHEHEVGMALRVGSTKPILIGAPPITYHAGPSTPDLAHSVNSFFSNVSSSPSTSINLVTPGSSPPHEFLENKLDRIDEERSSFGRSDSDYEDDRDMDFREAIETTLPMEGLDLEFDDPGHAPPTREHSRRGSDEESQASSHTSPEVLSSSLELVRYTAPLSSTLRTSVDEAFRIPEPMSVRGGIFSSRPLQHNVAYEPSPPKLPSALLASILGRPYVASMSTPTMLPKVPKDDLHLPLVLPYEVVKTLYDSVDFGVMHAESSSLPGVTLPSVMRRPRSPPSPSSQTSFVGRKPSQASSYSKASGGRDARDSVKSAPTSPRPRSKSLTGSPDIEFDSSGSLLFSSLGLYSRLSGLSATQPIPSIAARLDEPLFQEDQAFNSSGFGRGIVNEWMPWEQHRSSVSAGFGGTRNDSRSPSRLRLNIEHQENALDFEFGSI